MANTPINKFSPEQIAILEKAAMAEAVSKSMEGYRFDMRLDVASLMVMVSAVQLATRHPRITPAVKDKCDTFVELVIARLVQDGLRDIAGFFLAASNPANDETPN